MNEIESLLALAKEAALDAAKKLHLISIGNAKKFEYSEEISREMKAEVDLVLDHYIISRLRETNIDILSEESGFTKGNKSSSLLLIVDPLDGTINYIRGCGPSAVSIALWHRNEPIFGVICNISTMELAWGGKNFGSFLGSKRIKVSNIKERNKSIFYTGIPSRLNLDSKENLSNQIRLMSLYGKIRMIGSASISLLQIAKGCGEVYSENKIMIWDVAAGLAILEGAGGGFTIKTENFNFNYPIEIHASNIKRLT
jgi:myo-inositol-1(or 4)-monophosphatase